MKLFDRHLHKKGSLELSINAIVILVMAMVVLGLGLSFIRTLIGKGQDNIGSVLDNTNLKNPANAERPVTIDYTVKLTQGKQTKVEISYYNARSETITDAAPGNEELASGFDFCQVGKRCITCVGNEGTEAYFPIFSPTIDVNGGDVVGYSAILKDSGQGEGSDKSSPGLYSCTLPIAGEDDSGAFIEAASSSFFLEIGN